MRLELIKQITSEGYDFVSSCVQNHNYIVYLESTDSLIIRVWNDELDVIYGITTDETPTYLDLLKHAIIQRQSSKECCVNVYGENLQSIQLIKQLGISIDQHGYQMVCDKVHHITPHIDLIVEPYSPRYIEQVATIFDDAYHITVYQKMGVSFNQDLVQKAKRQEAFIAFLNGELVASYILDRNYISEFVVSPLFQGKGIGAVMLNHTVKQVLRNNKEVLIRVRKNNHNAIRLYQRYGFSIIGNYAEHTKS